MSHDTEMRRLRGFGDTNFALLGQREGAEAPAAVPLPEVMFAFDAQGQSERRWQVRHFEAVEGLSTLYECVVDLAAHDLTESPDALLGRYAVLQWQRESVLRKLYGVVRRVEHRGATGSHRLARAVMVPALWALSQRSDARIFQGLTAVEVVQAVLQEAGLYAGMLELQLQRAYPPREYCVQHRETDLAFVTRLLEAEGITWFFRHDDEGETLVLADGAHAWEAVRTMDGGPVPIAGAEVSTERVEAVRHLRWERELRPTGAVVRDFDFTRPDLRLERMAPRRRDGARTLYEPAPAVTLGQYASGVYTRDDAQEQAQLRHEAEQVPGAVGQGEGVVVGMAPGGLFALTLAGTHIPAQRYVLTRVEHVGDAPEVVLQGTAPASQDDRYRNRFACIPVEVAFRPARVTPRPTIAGMQTATVTGPAGEEVYTDAHGRVRVQFHWDRHGARDEHATCWLRTMQGPWAGNGWGMQFVPRVGMEVGVTFVEGDPDKPVILGALYNGNHAPPFALPGERTRGGVRTQSVGGVGYNELSFEDAAGQEQVLLRAQRDHDELVVRNQSTHVGGDRALVVTGSRSVHVTRDQRHVVSGHDHADVAGDRGSHVGGSARCAVDHDAACDVGGAARVSARRGFSLMVGGAGDQTAEVQVEGDLRLSASTRVRAAGERAVVLQCGSSTIEIGPDEVRIDADRLVLNGRRRASIFGDGPALQLERELVAVADAVRLFSSGASLRLSDRFDAHGSAIHLDRDAPAPELARPDDGAPAPTRPLRLTVRDARGEALAGRAYVLMAAGQRFTGSLGGDGVLSVEVPRAAETAELSVVVDDVTPPCTLRWHLSLAAMPGADDVRGAQLRLRNLGRFHGAVSGELDDATRDALRAFQHAHDLPETGALDGATVGALREHHGA